MASTHTDENKLSIPRHLSRKDLQERQRNAVSWYLNKIKQIGRSGGAVQPEDLFHKRVSVRDPQIGQILFFEYDALTKDKLRYWDRFPLSVVIGIDERSFLSLNLHYLDYSIRARVVDMLLDSVTAWRSGHKVKAQISYSKIAALGRWKLVTPAIKRHLFSQIRSKIVRINVEDWQEVIYLPVDRFQKASREEVWAESRDRLRSMASRYRNRA